MAIIYRVLEMYMSIQEEYFKSLEGAAETALRWYKEHLLSMDLLYTNVYPCDITAESIQKLMDELHSIDPKWPTVTVVCQGGYTLTVTEVWLND